jgi:hypothetical protein
MTSNLILEVAQRRVEQYAGESESARGDVGLAGRQGCEDHLKRAIEAQRWLLRAEQMLREADALGILVLTAEVRQALDGLYSSWLAASADAEKWLAALAQRGCVPGNLAAFRAACEEIEDLMEQKDWQRRADRIRVANSSEEEW